MDEDGKKASSYGEAMRVMGPYITLGIQFVLIILICVYAGHWADGKFDTAPILTLVGGLFGIAAGFYQFLKEVLGWDKKDGDEDP